MLSILQQWHLQKKSGTKYTINWRIPIDGNNCTCINVRLCRKHAVVQNTDLDTDSTQIATPDSLTLLNRRRLQTPNNCRPEGDSREHTTTEKATQTSTPPNRWRLRPAHELTEGDSDQHITKQKATISCTPLNRRLLRLMCWTRQFEGQSLKDSPSFRLQSNTDFDKF